MDPITTHQPLHTQSQRHGKNTVRASAVLRGLFFILLLTPGCHQQSAASIAATTATNIELPDKLSALNLFMGNLADQIPSPDVHPYELNSPLFSDYTTKYRFIRLPHGASMSYRGDDDTLVFPVGTIIAKTFAYMNDQRDPRNGQKLIETRILRLNTPGVWEGVSYVWNSAQTEATIKLTGTISHSEWTHNDGTKRSNAYIVPNANQCKSCHGPNNDPIGPKPRNLQRDLGVGYGPNNQLERWTQKGNIKQLPDPTKVARLPVWNDTRTGTLDQRARAWLDINCAHCHNPAGGAKQSGLDLRYTQTDSAALGIMKVPVAAGRGSGGKSYDIVPGKPDDSVLVFRIESTEPGIMMPELPRRMIDVEGVQLIRQWISEMKK